MGASLCQIIQLTKYKGDPFLSSGSQGWKNKNKNKNKKNPLYFQVTVLDDLACQQFLPDFIIVDLWFCKLSQPMEYSYEMQ